MIRYLLIGLLTLVASTASAQQSEYAAPYDGIRAGLDSYYYGEALRQQKIDRQLSANDQMRWWRGLPPLGEANRYPPSLDYIYVTGRRGLFGRYRERVYYGTRDVFMPWPTVPGDIWGSVDTSSVPQSIGQRQTQTGPDRWESHPVYDEPFTPAQSPFDVPVVGDLPSSTAREF